MTSQPKIESQLQLEAEGSQKDRLAWSDAPAGCSPIPAGTPRVGEAGGRRWWLARSMDWAARPGWALGCGEQSGGWLSGNGDFLNRAREKTGQRPRPGQT